MVKRRLMSIMLAVALLIVGVGALVACTDNKDVFKVDVFIYDTVDEYGAKLSEQIQKQAEKNPKVKVTIYNGDYFTTFDAAKQLQQIDDVLSSGTDLIFVALGDYASAPNVAKKANDKGVQVIFGIREPFKTDQEYAAILGEDNPNTAFVGLSDIDRQHNIGSGSLQGELIAKYLTEGKYKVEDGTVVNYIQFRGNLGNPAADRRSEHSIKRAKELLIDRNITLNAIEEDQDVFWSGDEAKDRMKGFLESGLEAGRATSGNNGKVNLILANSDDMVIGAINALADYDINTGKDGDDSIITIGMDALTNGKEYIGQGRLTATLQANVEFNATIIVEMIANAIGGKTGAGMTDGLVDKLNSDDNPLEVTKDGRDVSLFYTPYTGNLTTTR
jgi:methyl-galactoside transport system substrate-binding protein